MRARSTSEMARFETDLLATEENLSPQSELSGRWIDRVHERTGLKTLALDMDSSDSPTFGQQEGSTFNGHFRCTCYHPLFVFNQSGDLERAMLRPGNVHSSKEWREILEPMMARYRGRKPARSFRADAAFERPEVYEFLEAEGFGYDRRHDANGLNASGACGRASQNRGLGSGLPARRRRGPAGFFSKRSPRSIKATLAVSHTWGLGNFLIGLNITEKLITYWAFSSWLFCLAR